MALLPYRFGSSRPRNTPRVFLMDVCKDPTGPEDRPRQRAVPAHSPDLAPELAGSAQERAVPLRWRLALLVVAAEAVRILPWCEH